MKTTTFRNLAVGALAAAALTVGFASTASATDGPSAPTTEAPVSAKGNLETARARCIAAIDKRLATITELQGRVNGSASVTDGHKATLTTVLTDASTGLSALKTQITAATDRDTLKPLCQSISVDFRIYALRVPQVRQVLILDEEQAKVTTLTATALDLQSQITAKHGEGKDTSKAEASLARMNNQITAAKTATAGVADTIIVYGPADWNGNHDLMKSSGAAARTGGKALAKASAAGVRCQAQLDRLS